MRKARALRRTAEDLCPLRRHKVTGTLRRFLRRRLWRAGARRHVTFMGPLLSGLLPVDQTTEETCPVLFFYVL